MSRAKVQLDIKEKAPIKFVLDCVDTETLFLVPELEYDADLYTIMNDMPEHKWRNIDGAKGWTFSARPDNITYIQRYYVEGKDYLLSGAAKIIVQYEKLQDKVHQLKAQKRWEYLFNGKTSDFVVPSNLTSFDHQIVAVEAAYNAEYFGYLMEMGTGKTPCVINELQLYACNMEQGEMIRAVVVCPKALCFNWEREFKKFFNDCINIHIEVMNKGDTKSLDQMAKAIRSISMVKILIVPYDSVPVMLKQLTIFKPTYLAFDECHYLKNSETKRWKACNALAEVSGMRRILTGTPAPNNIVDLWAQFQILRPGILGYNTVSGFKKAYCVIEQDATGRDKIVGVKNIDRLRENMARVSFIVKKEECLDLPEKMYDTIALDMPDSVRAMYDQIVSDFFTQLDTNLEVSTEYIIVQMLKLSQVCAGFVIAKEFTSEGVDSVDSEEDGWKSKTILLPGADYKMDVMCDEAEEVVQDGKLIIWSRFKVASDMIKAKLASRGIRAELFNGSTKDADRIRIVDEFNTADDLRVIIANQKSGGVGLNLLGTKTAPSHTAFFFSNDFSYGNRLQAEDRQHRIGQTNKVLYKDFVYKNSIEQYIAMKLQGKKDIENMVKNMGEIKELLLKAKEGTL